MPWESHYRASIDEDALQRAALEDIRKEKARELLLNPSFLQSLRAAVKKYNPHWLSPTVLKTLGYPPAYYLNLLLDMYFYCVRSFEAQLNDLELPKTDISQTSLVDAYEKLRKHETFIPCDLDVSPVLGWAKLTASTIYQQIELLITYSPNGIETKKMSLEDFSDEEIPENTELDADMEDEENLTEGAI
jgi:hypothetical protein